MLVEYTNRRKVTVGSCGSFRRGGDDSDNGCSQGGWCQRRGAVSKTDHHPRDNVTRRTHHTPLDVRIYRLTYRGNAPELTPKNIEYFALLKLQDYPIDSLMAKYTFIFDICIKEIFLDNWTLQNLNDTPKLVNKKYQIVTLKHY